MLRILFVDPDHGPRSQMAAAMLVATGMRANISSAGTAPQGRLDHVGPVLAEAGVGGFIPARTQLSEAGPPPDVLVAVCEEGCAACPYVPGSGVVRRWPLPDPGSVPPAGRVDLLRMIREQLVPLVRDLAEELRPRP